MQTFFHHFQLAVPLFVLVFVGYALVLWGRWPQTAADALSRFVFAVALPAMLFGLMSDLSRLPPVDSRVLAAFFGSCFLVFGLGRLIAWRLFRLDGVGQSVFALGGVFSNNVLLGLPVTKATLGEAAMPTVALVVVFNALTLWTLATVSVEWARYGTFSLSGLGKMVRSVATNPLVAAIVTGSLFGLTGLPLPDVIGIPLHLIGDAAAPMSLVVLGMGLARYGLRAQWEVSLAITAIKLLLQPLCIWLLARLLGLGTVETQAVVLLGSMAVGANVYLMSKEFRTLEGPVAASLVMSTALAALTTPLFLTLTGAQP